MRTHYLFIVAVFFLASCRTDDENGLGAPVNSFFDLPTDYRPIQEGSVATGRLKSEVHGGQLSGEWRYNQQGKLAEWRHYRSGQLSTVDQYRYDVAGRLRYVQHFEDGCAYSSLSSCSGPVKWTGYNEIMTDNAGRILKSRSFLKLSKQWELRSTSTYEYDSQNRPVKVIQQYEYNASRSIRTQEFGYDGKDNIV
uniref:hypothetical protein n=1 Tax=Spirosoma sp. TaxID=1899569 RepID=UPI003B3B8EE8